MATKVDEQARVMDAAAIQAYLSNQDDFALELRVLRLARGLAFQTRHSGTYQDPFTGKPRQYDLRIHRQSDAKRVAFAIECKALSPAFPLIVSRVPRTRAESFHCLAQVQTNRVPPGYVTTRTDSRNYPSEQPVAKATAQFGWGKDGAIKANDSATYEKWSQALSSARDLMLEAIPPTGAPAGPLLAAIFPVLVVSNLCLWAVDYAEDGQQNTSPTQVDEAALFVDQEYDVRGNKFRVSHLQICTEAGLAALLNSASQDDFWWDRVFDA